MIRILSILPLVLLLAAPIAEARPGRHSGKLSSKSQASAALKTRQSAMDDFSARMSRLDALMGAPASLPTQARSAAAGR